MNNSSKIEQFSYFEISENAKERIGKCQLFILDIDGTFYISGKLFDGSKRFYEAIKRQSRKMVFLTNNSNRTLESYVEEFKDMGIEISKEQIVTAGVATAQYLYDEFGSKKVYVVGTEDIKLEFQNAGHQVVEDNPEIVVVTFDKTLTYEKLKKATQFISKGALFVVTNPDLNCPSDEGPLPDAGAIASLIRKASGMYPNIVFGKPEPKLIEMVMKHNNVTKEETCMVGDRLYTDILAGLQAGTLTCLVLTGEATLEQAEKNPIKPHLVAKDIGTLADIINGVI
ncbi:MAG: HAD-IIA family hydrolase [Fervidobacterium sp.]|uniref:NagD protein n=1 Tax=Fervidobacterium gondwanense DSM 13020 TaxID=1121883 RepID=A0A1M7SD16_FERGO|nr:HAD-IIA family hydrolase [Fervidobacterium gondwanense]SHN56397.1 NagD protein [Fervidobacterium gondwanense DSM 13020]